jgi:hypothetical protein
VVPEHRSLGGGIDGGLYGLRATALTDVNLFGWPRLVCFTERSGSPIGTYASEWTTNCTALYPIRDCAESRFPDIFPEITEEDRYMPRLQKKTLSAYRRRQKQRGVLRLEVAVRKGDASLIRGVAKALSDPARAAETRALLRERFGALQAKGLKELLAAAPLEGIDLTRQRDLGRDVAL